MDTEERRILARARDLADTDEPAEEINQIIARARSTRVDREALRGLAVAVRALGSDPQPALADRYGDRFGHYASDAEMFEAIREADDELASLQRDIAELAERAQRFRSQARRDRHAAEAELSRATAMPTKVPCTGCHEARQDAIDTARAHIADAQSRIDLTAEAIDTLRQVDIAPALAGLRQVPDDYEETYAASLELVRTDPDGLPKDGNFITGYGSMLLPREVTGSAADVIRRILQLAHGDTEETQKEPGPCCGARPAPGEPSRRPTGAQRPGPQRRYP